MITESPFLYLTCDLPPTPLFTDEFRENIIPQVTIVHINYIGRSDCSFNVSPLLSDTPTCNSVLRTSRIQQRVRINHVLFLQVNLYQLLSKFNGQTSKEYKTYKENFLKRFEITQLPPYLILYIKRFTKNTFFVEKNPTVVNFPVK